MKDCDGISWCFRSNSGVQYEACDFYRLKLKDDDLAGVFEVLSVCHTRRIYTLRVFIFLYGKKYDRQRSRKRRWLRSQRVLR